MRLRAYLVKFQKRQHRRLRRVQRAAPVVAQQDALGAVLDGPARVRRRLHPLEHDGQAPRHPLDPGQVLPDHRRVDVAAHDAPEPAALRVAGRHGAADARGPDVGARGGDALVGLALARHGRVDGEEHAAHAEALRLGEEVGRLLPVRVDVELEKEGLAGPPSGDDVLEWVGRVGRYLRLEEWLASRLHPDSIYVDGDVTDNLADVLVATCSCYRELTVRVGKTSHSRGAFFRI